MKNRFVIFEERSASLIKFQGLMQKIQMDRRNLSIADLLDLSDSKAIECAETNVQFLNKEIKTQRTK